MKYTIKKPQFVCSIHQNFASYRELLTGNTTEVMRSANPVGFPASTVVGLIRSLCANPLYFCEEEKTEIKETKKKI